MNYMTIGVLVMLFLSGGIVGSKINSLNPFKSNNKVYVQKSKTSRIEYYKDRVKGFEHRIEERSENKTPIAKNLTVGQTVGSFIDNSFQLLLWYFFGGIAVLLLTGFNIFKWTKKKLYELNMYRKSSIQTSKAIQIAKKKMNGETKKLLDALDSTQDEDVKTFIRKFKDENNIR